MLATLTVSVNNDGTIAPNDGNLTLREAIAYVNTEVPPGPGDLAHIDLTESFGTTDTIKFAPGLNGATITLTQGELAISESVTIDGADSNGVSRNITIQVYDPSSIVGNGSRVFNIIDTSNGAATPLVTLNGLTLTGGDVFGSGGAIASAAANLTVLNCTIQDNVSVFDGGGVWATGNLTIIDSTISGNHSHTSTNKGGGIYFSGTSKQLTILESTISGNSAVHSGGGVWGRECRPDYALAA